MSTCPPDINDHVVQGDLGEFVIGTLDGVEDLSTATAFEAHVKFGKGFNEIAATLVTTLADATARTVRIEYGAALGWLATAVPGSWMIEVQVNWGPNIELTWPRRQDVGAPRVNVRAELA